MPAYHVDIVTESGAAGRSEDFSARNADDAISRGARILAACAVSAGDRADLSIRHRDTRRLVHVRRITLEVTR
jgi:hypothetical protein